MQAPYLIGYRSNGKVELGWFFETFAAAQRWARHFARGFESILIYDATGNVVATVQP